LNLQKNIWCCKSTSCNQIAKKKGGDVLDFVALMEQTPVLSAAKKLLEWFPQGDNEKAPASNGTKPKESGAVVVPQNPTPVLERSSARDISKSMPSRKLWISSTNTVK
jgi:hypothetical protein